MQRGNREVKEAEGENKTCNHVTPYSDHVALS